MSLRHHPEDSTLLGYAAGALPQSIAILVAAHLEVCAACRGAMRTIGTVAGAALHCAPCAALQEDAFERLAARLHGPGAAGDGPPAAPVATADLPTPLARLVGGGTEAVAWAQVLPGIEHCRIALRSARGESALRLIRARPGLQIPDHTHSGQEATLVLRGALGDGEMVYRAGEFCDLDETVTHNPRVHGDETCLCAIAEEGPPLFVSPQVASYLRQAGI